MVADGSFVTKMTAHVIEQIETRLREVHLVSSIAKSFAAQGLDERSVETLLGIEQLIYEVKALLEAVDDRKACASVVIGRLAIVRSRHAVF